MIQQFLQVRLDLLRGLFEIFLLTVAIYYGYLYFRGTRGAKASLPSWSRNRASAR